MSNHLAIAHVTAALGKAAHVAARNAVPGIGLTYGRPEVTNTTRRVNVYPYQVVTNAARRNDELPSRGAEGALARRPAVALDVHYLISFHGRTEAFEPERMAGAVARELHTNPVLDGTRLADGANGEAVLDDSDLGAAPDRVRITPLPMTLEEVSRLWSVLIQTPYVLSLPYEASVLLIDALARAPSPQPVLRRGRDGRGAIVGGDRLPRLGNARIGFTGAPAPALPLASLPAAALGTSVVVEGTDLQADTLELDFLHPTGPALTMVIPPADRSDRELRFSISGDAAAAAAWSAGLYAVTARIERDGKELVSPVWPLLLAPRLDALSPNPVAAAGAQVDITATVRPHVRAAQRAVMRVGPVEVPAQPRAADGDPLVFRLDPAPALAEALVRIEVDGVESMPVTIDPQTRDFTFDPEQRLTIT